MKYNDGVKRTPARIWSFGASAPVEGGAAVQQQHRMAHWYRNTLVYIERDRRRRAELAVKRHFPELGEIETEVMKADAAIEAMRAAISEANSIARRKGEAKELQQQVKSMKEVRKTLYEQRKSMRVEAFAGPSSIAKAEKQLANLMEEQEPTEQNHLAIARAREELAQQRDLASRPRTKALRVDLAVFDELAIRRQKRLRSAVGGMRIMRDRIDGKWVRVPCEPLPWGVRGEIEMAMASARQGAPPEFVRWRERGASTVQIQGGTTPEKIMAGACTQLVLTPGDETIAAQRRRISEELIACKDISRRQVLKDQLRGLDSRGRVSVRIGSEGQKPIFATAPIVLHRQLPADAKIKLASLRMDRGDWKMQFTLTRDSWLKGDEAETGGVGIDVGWRMTEAGLRVAYWVGDDGEEGELVLPADCLPWFDEDARLRSVRDNNFNAVRKCLSAWLKGESLPEEATEQWRIFSGRAIRMQSKDEQKKYADAQWEFAAAWKRWREAGAMPVPESLRERLKFMTQWKSHERLIGTIEWWRDNRFRGDNHAYDALEGWRKQELHLRNWESNGTAQRGAWRKNLYRNFAAALRRRYATAYIEDLNLTEMQRNEKPEERAVPGAVKEHARTASLSVLLGALTNAMRQVVKRESVNSTRTCAECRHVNQWPDASALHQTCESCGVTWDQDKNAAKVLLAGPASTAVVE